MELINLISNKFPEADVIRVIERLEREDPIMLGQPNEDGCTPLIIACDMGMNKVVLKLIETGYSNPGHVDKYGATALQLACFYAMNEVALKLIETGQSKPEQVANNGLTALSLARQYTNMKEVVIALNEVLKINKV